jgi:glycosidase
MQHRCKALMAMLIGIVACCVAPSTLRAEGAGPLHVPSPDWRDQVIYFVMLDRFDDGDPANNDQGAGEFDPADRRRFSGGDLRGAARRLDYVQGLGATALWITPPVANQWRDPGDYGGYHGYWATDFTAVDAHLGTLDDYRALSRALHGRGMYLVQDIVLNHVGNWIRYPHAWSADDPARGFVRVVDAQGRGAPLQPPFDRNDARDPAQRDASIYHWTPPIRDNTVRAEELRFQLADLDDLNTANPVVREALRRSYAHWITEVGVDAFRVDTAFYVEPAFLDDFVYGTDPEAPGALAAARATGRHGFHVFGEGFAIDRPYDDRGARKIERYMAGIEGAMPAMINFPLYGSAQDVFARGAPTAVLGHRIRSMLALHARVHWMPTFVDNHDVDRFLAGGDEAGLRQALLMLMTLPGIPTIYYGTEQGFTRPRESMFGAGWGGGGRDRFDAASPLYRYLAAAIALRRANPVLSRGTPEVLHENAAGPGAIAWRTTHAGATALVAFNTARAPALLDNLDTGLAPGSTLRGAFAIDGTAPAATVGADGRIHLALAPRGGWVWLVDAAPGAQPAASTAAQPAAPAIDPLPVEPVGGDLDIGGSAAAGATFALVVDGALDSAQRVRADAQGRWRARIDTGSMVDPAVVHRAVAWDATTGAASAPATFRVARRWTEAARIDDPAGDDQGPEGRYRYPTDASWSANRQADLRGALAEVSGGALRLSLDLAAVTTSWNPANGFDHVAFGIAIGFPGESGARALPLQNATFAGDGAWQYRMRAHGWSNALFSAAGASATEEGRSVVPAASIAVDRAKQRVVFTFPAAALGNRRTLAGARIHVTTWDYDGGWRALTPQPGSHSFGGGDGARDPLVMDELVLDIPAQASSGRQGIGPRVQGTGPRAQNGLLLP